MNENHDSCSHSTSSGMGMLGGLLLGAAVGAGVALLLAPASGSETRSTIGRRARRLGQQSRDMVDDMQDSVSDGMYTLDKAARNVKKAVGDGMERVDSAVREGRATFLRDAKPVATTQTRE